ncbi:alpha/beta-Hydrolases superfamily protein [Zea mays]|uniref:Alpha/beta-Hydrolases superfamily protein n=1 Tax=Zea mays TaxID=4577 RepID=C0PK14_MAIZE|nr:unknown [Zea mays]AQK84781.1 alpha/beta-Hydrolases superfamily protein [Zea mays]AQK84783.1 alpha/beta-Hydrolases superfamily protein [Zea mays]
MTPSLSILTPWRSRSWPRWRSSTTLALRRPYLLGNTSPHPKSELLASLASSVYLHCFRVIIIICTCVMTIAPRHSAGCLVAVDAYFEAPERVAALVLVAPAIFAPRKAVKEGQSGEEEGGQQAQRVPNDENSPPNLFARISGGFLELWKHVAGLVLKMITAIRDVVRSLCLKAVVAFLRSSLGVVLVRWVMDKFGILGVRNAWYDPSKVTDHVIQGYTKPLKSKGWETALLEHTVSMIIDSVSASRVPVSKRLSEISCPVLVVTGDTDRIVPAWNAERVARAIPGATFEAIKSCGHLPHEERPEEFLSVVENFLRTTFANPNEQVFQAAVS